MIARRRVPIGQGDLFPLELERALKRRADAIHQARRDRAVIRKLCEDKRRGRSS